MTEERLNRYLVDAIRAKAMLEENPCEENAEAWHLRRGRFRGAVIDVVKEQLWEWMQDYIDAAQAISESYNAMIRIDGWLREHDLHTPIYPEFFDRVSVPPPIKGLPHSGCGHQIRPFTGIFDHLSNDAAQVFEGTFQYHDERA